MKPLVASKILWATSLRCSWTTQRTWLEFRDPPQLATLSTATHLMGMWDIQSMVIWRLDPWPLDTLAIWWPGMCLQGALAIPLMADIPRRVIRLHTLRPRAPMAELRQLWKNRLLPLNLPCQTMSVPKDSRRFLYNLMLPLPRNRRSPTKCMGFEIRPTAKIKDEGFPSIMSAACLFPRPFGIAVLILQQFKSPTCRLLHLSLAKILQMSLWLRPRETVAVHLTSKFSQKE